MNRTRTLYRGIRPALAALLLTTLALNMAVSNGHTQNPDTPQQKTPSVQRGPTRGVAAHEQTSRESNVDANTLKVSPILSEEAVSQLVKHDLGATLSAKGSNGTRFTLTVPKGALVEDVTITMTPVAGINDMPFHGGLVAAVQIKPEDVLLSRPLTLLIDPPAAIPAADQLSFASFSYRSNGNDFHLYPLEIDPSRIAFRLVNFGSYGIARGTDAEQETVRQRPPADPADRMMMDTQKLNRILRERLLRRGSVRLRHRHEQSPFKNASFKSPTGGESAMQQAPNSNTFNPASYLENLLNTIRLSHNEIMSRLKGLKFDCRANVRIRVREVISEALRWQHAVAVNGLLEKLDISDLTAEEKEMVIRSRLISQGLSGPELERAVKMMTLSSITEAERYTLHANRLRRQGYTEQEIDVLIGEGKAITEEIQRLQDSLNELCWETLSKGFNKAYQCCMCEPKDFHLDMMIGYWRQMTLISETRVFEVVDPAQLAQCEDMIRGGGRLSGGVWRGTVTYKSVVKKESSGKVANSFQYRKLERIYEAKFVASGRTDEHGRQIGRLSASAEEVWDDGGHGLGPCYRVSQQLQKVSGTVVDDSASLSVYLSPRTGRYTITVSWPLVSSNGTYTVTSDVKGTCPNPFNRSISHGSDVKDFKISPYGEGRGEGPFDENYSDVLSGTKVTHEPVGRDGTAETTVTWNLSRCKAN